MADINDDITALKITAEGVFEKVKEKLEKEGPRAIPDILILVQVGVSVDGEIEKRDFLGVGIGGNEREKGIREVLAEFPHAKSYALIMHANTYVVSNHGGPPPSLDEVKKAGTPKRDSLILILVQVDKQEILKAKYYEIHDGEVRWLEDDPLFNERPLIAEAAPYFTNPLLSEDDFE